MKIRKIINIIFLAIIFSFTASAQFKNAFDRNDVEQLDQLFLTYQDRNQTDKYIGNEDSGVLGVFLQDYIQKQKITNKYIRINPRILSVHLNRLILDTVGGNYLVDFEYSDVLSIKKDGFNVDQYDIKVLSLGDFEKQAITDFLYQSGTFDEYSLNIYQKKIAFLQKKLVLESNYLVLGKDKANKKIFGYDLSDNICVEQITFNKNKDSATLIYRNKYSINLVYVKKFNNKWKFIYNKPIVQY